jgi:transcriptional regulator with XRE-family HTH domain
MPEPHEPYVILRDRDGAPQHVVLPWDAFQRYLNDTSARPGVSEAVAQGSRRLPVDIAAEVPGEVLRREADGMHPVRAWREWRGHSQAQLATLVGISRAYLAQIETGERIGTLEVTARLARCLGCLIEDLVREPADGFSGRVAVLARMPGQVRALVDAVARERRRARPIAGGFSVTEHVCHLRDIDAEGYSVRLECMLTMDNPPLTGIEGDVLARERDYQSQSLDDAFAIFAEARAGIVERLARLGPDERQRTGLMGGTNPITIDDLVSAMLTHDSSHLDEMAALRNELGAAY